MNQDPGALLLSSPQLAFIASLAALSFAGCASSPGAGTSGATNAGSAGSPSAAGTASGSGGAGAGNGGAGNGGAGSRGISDGGSIGLGNVAGSSAGSAGGGAGGSAGSGSGGGTGCSGKALCWDFEEGKIPDGWTKRFDQPSGELLVDGTKPYGGSKYSLHAKDIVGAQPQKSIIYNLPASFGPVLWGRARVYTSPTRPDSHAGIFAAYYLPVGSATTAMNTLDWYEVASYTQAYMSIWHPPWPPGFPESVQVSDTKLTLDKWTCVEWQFDGKNDADPQQAALPRVWLDGVELMWPMKFAFSDQAQMNETQPKRTKATNFTVIETGVTMWQKMDTPNNWWIDDLGVGPDRIGCN